VSVIVVLDSIMRRTMLGPYSLSLSFLIDKYIEAVRDKYIERVRDKYIERVII
jgi:hypothetical protein